MEDETAKKASLWDRLRRSELNPFVEADLSEGQMLTERDVWLSELRTRQEREAIARALEESERAPGRPCGL